MRVTVISPERALFDGQAAAVIAPAYDGLVGILPRHAPFMTLLGSGVLRVRPHREGEGGKGEGVETSLFRVAGGFLQVEGDVVRIVADRVETA